MQKHSFNLAKYMARCGVHVDVYHTVSAEKKERPPEDALYSQQELSRIRFIEVPRVPRMRFPGHYLRESYLNSGRYFEILRDQAPVHFIYVQGLSGWKTINEKRGGCNLPPVGVNMHGLEMYQKPASVRAKLEHYMFRPFISENLKKADIAFTLGGGLGRIIQSLGIAEERIVESPNGVPDTWLSSDINVQSKPTRFVFLGRYERRKGIEELHRALKQLSGTHEFEFHFIGPIPEKLQLNDRRVTYWGLVRDEDKVRSILHQGDVLVCPSYSEGMPTVILEAMATGMAVIATNVGAVDALVSNENGWLISPGNHGALMEAMQDAIQLSDGELQIKKERGRDLVRDKYLWDRVAEKTIAGIEHVLTVNEFST